MKTSEWRALGEYFDFKGRKIFFRKSIEASKPVVLLIHGFPTASWDWFKMWPILEEKYSLVAPDMLGFGFSDKPKDHDYSLMEQADIMEATLIHLGVQQVDLLVHDYGVSVAQELLARNDERLQAGISGINITSCIFLNGGLFPETHRPRLVQKLLLSPLGFLVCNLMNKKSFDRGLADVFGPNTKPSKAELEACWELVQFNDGQGNFHRLIRYMIDRRTHRARWVGVLQTTKVPLIVIDGPEDPVSGLHMTERYKELVPNPKVVLLPGIGHYPNIEAPEATAKAALTFLSGIHSQ